jgi:hypothetical protein
MIGETSPLHSKSLNERNRLLSTTRLGAANSLTFFHAVDFINWYFW